MDAHALLKSQGWRGTGHSLHPTSDSTGLAKPLLVSQKQNNLGIGKKQHKTSDMWWMNAFDKTLKGLDTSKEGIVVQTLTSGGLDMVIKGGARFVGNTGGLYASFVRGECLSGTITPEEDTQEPKAKRRRKEEERNETKEERRARKAAKRAARSKDCSTEEEAQEVVDQIHGNQETEDSEVAIDPSAETKEEAKERKMQKKLRRQSKQDVSRLLSDKPTKKKRRKEASA